MVVEAGMVTLATLADTEAVARTVAIRIMLLVITTTYATIAIKSFNIPGT